MTQTPLNNPELAQLHFILGNAFGFIPFAEARNAIERGELHYAADLIDHYIVTTQDTLSRLRAVAARHTPNQEARNDNADGN